LFFGLTAGALIIVRARQPAPPGEAIAYAPGHPITTWLFVAVAAGVVLNSFVAYPAQSLIGSAVLTIAATIYFVVHRT
jgi:APA family basic amino acid/polyamine antiporter